MSGARQTLLITGANGFVGGALARHLAPHPGWRVIRGVRRRLGGADEQVIDLAAEVPLPSLQGIDVVVHCAARVHVMHEHAQNPLHAFRHINVQGTLRLAQAAAAAGVRRFVFISSIKVNGEHTRPGQPFRATDVPAPADPYGLSKWEAECALTALAAEHAMELVILRPVLVYGPGAGGNFKQLLRWVRWGIPLPLRAVNNRRSLVGLGNLVDFITLCCTHARAPGQVFLVSDGPAVSTAQLLACVASAAGQRARLFSVPAPLMRWLARLTGRTAWFDRLWGTLEVDPTPCTTQLGWVAPYTLDAGLAQALRGQDAMQGAES